MVNVTRNAGNSDVRSEQSKTCLFVAVRCVTHAKKICFGVARFTLSAISAFHKLSRMSIGMAIGTPLKFCDVKSEFSARVPPLLAVLMTVFAL
jgi:hypothetical protein